MIDILHALYDFIISASVVLVTVAVIFFIVALSTPIDPEDSYKYRNF